MRSRKLYPRLLQVTVPEEMHEALRLVADYEVSTVSSQVRAALNTYLMAKIAQRQAFARNMETVNVK